MRIHIVLQNVIIAICSIIPFSCSQPKANLSEVETVYVTSQHWPKTFHANSECKGLDNYSGDLYLADLDNLLITEYQPCGYCFNVTKLPTITPKDPEWIKQTEASLQRVYFSNDIKYSDGYYFLSFYAVDPNSENTTYGCYIFDKTLTKYREDKWHVEETFLDDEPLLFPITTASYAEVGVKFIRDQLSWRKAIMNVIPE